MLTDADYPKIKKLVWWFAKQQRRPADYELDDLVQDALMVLHKHDFKMYQFGWKQYIATVVWRLAADASRRAERRSVLQRIVYLSDGERDELLIDNIPDPHVEEIDDDEDYNLLIQKIALGSRRFKKLHRMGHAKMDWLADQARKRYAARIA